jgi:DNA-binding winged helix-turn-helix (wHTH) protein
MSYVFGDCALDTCLFTLQRAGQTVWLRPKVFRVCLYLLEHRDRVVSREELCAQVWPGQFISQATLEGVIRTVRQAVGDSGQAQGIIQTLHGYGYRFVAGVEERPTKAAGIEAQLASALLVTPEASALRQTDVVAASVASAQEPAVTSFPVGHGETRHCEACRNANRAEVSASIPLGERPTSSQRSQSVLQVARVVRTLAVLTLVILGGWALWLEVRQEATIPLDKSRIAVLPFVNFSAEADNTYWLIVAFGEPGLDRSLQALTCEGRKESESFPPYRRGQPAPYANRRHGRREYVVSSSWLPVSRSS